MADYWGIDFGGTRLRIGKLDLSKCNKVDIVLDEDISRISENDGLFNLVDSKIPKESKVGISAAGDVEEDCRIIKFSPNSKINGAITFGSLLEEDRGCKVYMTNDLKAAVQAEARYGDGKKYDNVLVATYSSGFNCAVTRKKKNVTTAELGHIRYKQDGDLFCGCGGIGHLESYVSGNGAASMAKQYFYINKRDADHPIILASFENLKILEGYKNKSSVNELYPVIISNINSKHIYEAVKSKPDQEPQKQIFNTQTKAIATSFGIMNSAFNPLDIMILMGSQTKDSFIFDKAIVKYKNEILQLPSLKQPGIKITELGDEIGVLGAIAYFQFKEEMEVVDSS